MCIAVCTGVSTSTTHSHTTEEVSLLFCRVALPVAACTTALRYALNHYIAGARLGVAVPAHNKRAVLLEEAWLFACSTVLLGLSTWVSERHNAGCSLLVQRNCYDGWPQQQDSTEMTIVLATFVGWYIHGVAKSLTPGVALRSGAHPSWHLPTCAAPSILCPDIFTAKCVSCHLASVAKAVWRLCRHSTLHPAGRQPPPHSARLRRARH